MKSIFAFVVFSITSLSGYSQSDARTIFFPVETEHPMHAPKKDNIWIFFMAGQSNMAGRGLVEPEDTISHPRIWTINKNNEVILAKEPLHFYEPHLTGLDCGLSFARELIRDLDDSITILLIPTAVGGSSIQQWDEDSLYRGVSLLSNFRAKMEQAKKLGSVKGILWHQGESDTKKELIPLYNQRLTSLFNKFRSYAENDKLPILIGELGSYAKNKKPWSSINHAIRLYVKDDKHSYLIDTGDLNHKGDFVHFNSEAQRIMGERFAKTYRRIIK